MVLLLVSVVEVLVPVILILLLAVLVPLVTVPGPDVVVSAVMAVVVVVVSNPNSRTGSVPVFGDYKVNWSSSLFLFLLDSDLSS